MNLWVAAFVIALAILIGSYLTVREKGVTFEVLGLFMAVTIPGFML